jgi:hypothetical protein
MRHPEPQIVKLWRENPGIPKCCHTCISYTQEGLCLEFESEPPQDFAESLNACTLWMSEDSIPF